MPRTKIIVDKTELVRIIDKLESENEYTNRSQLATEVSNYLEGISPSVVLLRIKEFKIEPKTPKGKRGRTKGIKLSDSQKIAMQAGRKPREVQNLVELKQYFPKSKHGLIDKIGKGSLIAAIKAKCLDCCNCDDTNVTDRIRECDILSCSLHSFRPYQK